MRVRIATLLTTTLLCLGAPPTARSDSRSEPLDNQHNAKVKVVLPTKDLWNGCMIRATQVEELLVSSDKVPSNHISSLAEAIGKVARKGLVAGSIICRDHLALPTPPKLGEDWLLCYSNADLSKRVGTKIAIKGFLTDWIIGGDHKANECAILSSDELTYVRIGLPCEFAKSSANGSEQHAASAQRAIWMNKPGINSVVIARGELQRCEANSRKTNASQNYFLLDQRTLTITESSWCN